MKRPKKKMIEQLNDYGELYINGNYCHMSAWEDPDGEIRFITDNNYGFKNAQMCVKYMLETVGKIIDWAANEGEIPF